MQGPEECHDNLLSSGFVHWHHVFVHVVWWRHFRLRPKNASTAARVARDSFMKKACDKEIVSRELWNGSSHNLSNYVLSL